MADGNGPKTAAERKRAQRERERRRRASNVVPMHPGDGEPPQPPEDDQGEVSLAELNSRMRRMAMSALTELGGTQYLVKVGKKNPNTFLRYAGSFIVKDETLNPGAFNIYVQQVVIEGAQPVRGVLASPVAGHVDTTPRYLAPPAVEVIEQEPRDA